MAQAIVDFNSHPPGLCFPFSTSCGIALLLYAEIIPDALQDYLTASLSLKFYIVYTCLFVVISRLRTALSQFHPLNN